MTIDNFGKHCLIRAINRYKTQTSNDIFSIDWYWTSNEISFSLTFNADALEDIGYITYDSAVDILDELKEKVRLLGVLNIVDRYENSNYNDLDDRFNEELCKSEATKLLSALLDNNTRYISNFIQEHKA